SMNTAGEPLMGRTEMDAQATKPEDAENDLKHLMDEVSRAMHKAQEAVVRITSTAPAARQRNERRFCRTSRIRLQRGWPAFAAIFCAYSASALSLRASRRCRASQAMPARLT